MKEAWAQRRLFAAGKAQRYGIFQMVLVLFRCESCFKALFEVQFF